MATTRALEDWEIGKIFAAVSGTHAVRNRTLLIVGLGLALRAHELIHLTVGDVSTDGGTVKHHITIRGETAKGGKARTIRVGEGVRGAIADFLKWKQEKGQSLDSQSPLFVSQKGRFLTREALFLLIKKLFQGEGVDQSPHSLRKTGGTIYYIESHFDLIATQRFLGHADPSTTRRYIGLTSEQLAEYAERVSDHLFAAIDGSGTAKFNTLYRMLNFKLKDVSDADLILELSARGRDVSSLIAQAQVERSEIPHRGAERRPHTLASKDDKVISIAEARRQTQAVSS